MVDVVKVVAVSVVVAVVNPPPPPTVPPVSFTVTTPLAGMETVTLPAERMALVGANVAVLLVAQAEAAVGVKSGEGELGQLTGRAAVCEHDDDGAVRVDEGA
jgi:hypothetical protein